jgi:uncharacterized RDD family membrane protein YckC
MYCSKCGTQLTDGTLFCTNCGQPVQSSSSHLPGAQDPIVPTPAPPQTYIPPVQPPGEQAVQQQPTQLRTNPQQPWQHGWPTTRRPALAYAGFWLRFFAYIIDSMLLGAVIGIGIFLPLLGGTLRTFSADSPWELYTSMARPLVALRLLGLMASWIYFATLESSAWQATLGKKALGLKVTDLEGNRITFARASGRFFGKILSGMILFIGFLMAGFTVRKQALHDILAGCLVLRQL